ncbi:hypothetical protein GCM10009837_48440 [Streptomyces durmitorensis]|uniref:DUF6332 family protein n=1 Tax=Streptomyces durmitorensis TaxID=319947 RepID=A0ABY4Q227_9ACTN|nr:DUF6332 family protein [Streptomyces durmitorensis]UQT60195.1 DUF6332 family protein [Streptomyces durmitorensis]
MGQRTQAQRDEATVEIGFALFVATTLAGAAFFAVPAAAHFIGLSSPSGHTLNQVRRIAAAAVFVVSVVTVLVRHRRARQPSQPGRTKPDS